MREAGARLVPVAMAEGLTGWDMDRWRQVLREAAPRIAYVVADFHNPTGALADEDQRRRLVDAARSAGTVLVADETMSELWLDEDVSMPRPVCAFDPAGSTVITVGSASKAFWAGMRIGWVRAAPDVIRSLVAARAYADLGTPVLEQLAVNWLFGTGGWEQAVQVRREQARENRDALVAAVRRELPDWEFEVPRGGLTLWVRSGGLSGSRLAEAGERVGVRVPSGPRFGVDGAFEGYVRLPFTVGGAVAEEAAVRLAAAARLVENGGGGSAEPRGPSWPDLYDDGRRPAARGGAVRGAGAAARSRGLRLGERRDRLLRLLVRLGENRDRSLLLRLGFGLGEDRDRLLRLGSGEDRDRLVGLLVRLGQDRDRLRGLLLRLGRHRHRLPRLRSRVGEDRHGLLRRGLLPGGGGPRLGGLRDRRGGHRLRRRVVRVRLPGRRRVAGRVLRHVLAVGRRGARGSSAMTALRWASLVASSYGSGVAGTWRRWTGPVPRRA